MRAVIVIVASLFHLAAVPDEKRTPGAVFPTVTKDLICRRGYAERMRHVTHGQKRDVCRAYGAGPTCPGPQWEVDHLIPLALGGSNDVSNLWPEPIVEAKQKDIVEDGLYNLLCAKGSTVTVEEAQHRVLNWREELPKFQKKPHR